MVANLSKSIGALRLKQVRASSVASAFSSAQQNERNALIDCWSGNLGDKVSS